MSDDKELIARLRENQAYEWQDPVWETRIVAADRIDELTRDLKSVLEREAETQARHDSKMDALEAKLAKAVAALTSIADNTCCGGCQEAALVARAAIKGEPK